MWFVFPQVAGLGRSPTSRYYAIHSRVHARAFLDHPLLGPRLRESVAAVLGWDGRRMPDEIFGPLDALKLRSSLTLFEAATGDSLFAEALDRLFAGERDQLTLDLLDA